MRTMAAVQLLVTLPIGMRESTVSGAPVRRLSIPATSPMDLCGTDRNAMRGVLREEMR